MIDDCRDDRCCSRFCHQGWCVAGVSQTVLPSVFYSLCFFAAVSGLWSQRKRKKEVALLPLVIMLSADKRRTAVSMSSNDRRHESTSSPLWRCPLSPACLNCLFGGRCACHTRYTRVFCSHTLQVSRRLILWVSLAGFFFWVVPPRDVPRP